MIISASRRTDIPSFYSRWFFNRVKEGYALVPNPYNPKMLSWVSLDRRVVDCIVFWTKNPAPMLHRLNELEGYNYYFQFTLNPYGSEIERKLPPVDKRIDTFRRLAEKIGPERVVWRYDPILTNAWYDTDFHRAAFERLVRELEGYTESCMLGFIDSYSHVRKSLESEGIGALTPEEIEWMAVSFAESATGYGIGLQTCAGKVNLVHLGIPGGRCVDGQLVERIAGYPIRAAKDRNQRHICNCVESIDIGTYESCLNDCLYCYAIKGNYGTAESNRRKHDPQSPLLVGRPAGDEVIRERAVKSLRSGEYSLF